LSRERYQTKTNELKGVRRQEKSEKGLRAGGNGDGPGTANVCADKRINETGKFQHIPVFNKGREEQLYWEKSRGWGWRPGRKVVHARAKRKFGPELKRKLGRCGPKRMGGGIKNLQLTGTPPIPQSL